MRKNIILPLLYSTFIFVLSCEIDNSNSEVSRTYKSDSIQICNEKYGQLKIYMDHKTLLYGLQDSMNNIILPAKYDHIYKPSGKRNSFRARLNERSGVVDCNGIETIPIIYKNFRGFPWAGRNVLRNESNKYGAIHNSGTIIIPFDYDQLTFNIDSTFQFSNGSDLVGIINDKNEVIIENTYEKIKARGGNYQYLQGRKWGVLSKNGKKILSNKYESITSISKNYIKLEKDGKFGIYDISTRKIILPIIYNKIEYFSDDDWLIKQNESYGLYHLSSQKFIVNVNYEKIYKLSETHLKIRKDNKFGIYNKPSKSIVVPIKYDDIEQYNNGMMVVTLGDQYGIVDTLHRSVLKMQELEIEDHHDEIAIVSKWTKERKGHITSYRTLYNMIQNNTLQLPQFIREWEVLDNDKWTKNKSSLVDDIMSRSSDLDYLTLFKNGKVHTQISDIGSRKYGYINGDDYISCESNDKWGAYIGFNKIFDFIYDEIHYNKIENPTNIPNPIVFIVSLNNQYGVMNDKQEVIIPIEYDKISFGGDGWIIKKDDKYGYYSWVDNKISIPIEYDSIAIREGRMVSLLSGKFGVVDSSNDEIVPFKYDSIERIGIGDKNVYLARQNNFLNVFDYRWRKISNSSYLEVKAIGKDTIHLKSTDTNEIVLWDDFFQSQF